MCGSLNNTYMINSDMIIVIVIVYYSYMGVDSRYINMHLYSYQCSSKTQ